MSASSPSQEYAYNQRINHAVDAYAKTKKYGDETQADRLQRINEARTGVREAQENHLPLSQCS